MIIQCAADFHGNRDKYKTFFKSVKDEKPDIIILPGDLGYIDEKEYDIPVPAFAVHGNMDGMLFLNKIKIVDETLFLIDNIRFLGLGWNFSDVVKDEDKEIKIEEAEFDIIISHIPPYKTKDRTFIGTHIGNKKLRKLMDVKRPSFVLCGHVHEDAGYDKFGDTIVINCSIGKKGAYTIIDTEEEKIRMVGY